MLISFERWSRMNEIRTMHNPFTALSFLLFFFFLGCFCCRLRTQRKHFLTNTFGICCNVSRSFFLLYEVNVFNPYRLFYFLHKCDVLMRWWSETEMGHFVYSFFFILFWLLLLLPFLSLTLKTFFICYYYCCCCCCWFASFFFLCICCFVPTVFC